MAPLPPPTPFPADYYYESRGYLVQRTAIAFILLEIIVVTLRFVSRSVQKTKLGADDYLIFPALFFCLGLCILGIVETYIAGVGRHLDVLAVTDPSAIINWSKCGYAIEQLYSVGVVFPRLSILASYLRIFRDRWQRNTAYALGGIIVANGLAGLITSFASCHPFSARWQGLEALALHCIDTVSYWRWISFPNILSDVVILVLPLSTVWSLKLSKKERIALTLIFLTGSIGLVTSIIRFTIFFNVTDLTYDGTFISADLAIWSMVEPGIYLVAACLPTLRPLVRKLFSEVRAVKSTKNSSSSSAPSGIQLEWRVDQRFDARRSDEDSILADSKRVSVV